MRGGALQPLEKGGLVVVFETVQRVIADELSVDAESITLETSFEEDLGADSLDIAELVMALEEEFDIEIGDDDLASVSTVGDVVSYIASRVNEE